MDKIIIKGLKVFAYHGVNKQEKENGQNFEIDAVLKLSLKDSGKSDDILDTVSYSEAVKVIVDIMQKEKYNLLEKVATQVASGLFNAFKALESVSITLKKPNAPIKADFNYMAVEISRKRDELNE